LALFESRLNREKFKKTISEYMQGLSDDVLEDKKAEMDRYLLCEIEDVSIPQEFGGTPLPSATSSRSFEAASRL
jgi:hypothetical protein